MKEIPFPPLPILPPEMLTSGNRRDCIRVRNLPMECGIEQILEFLGGHSQHIVSDYFFGIYSKTINFFFFSDSTRCSYDLQYPCKLSCLKRELIE